jgi:hypothetical protein
MASIHAKTTPATSKLSPIPIFATSVGASIDSFYRSSMNSLLNARLTNQRGSLFPNMHIQLPIRVVYINGIKNFRLYLDRNVKPEDLSFLSRGVAKGALAVTPGVVMTPFSSILEASNAGTSTLQVPFCGLL